MGDNPVQDETIDDRPEYLKFVAFLTVILLVVVGLALITPSIFNHVIPSVMGLNQSSTSGSVPAANDADISPESGIGGEPTTTEIPAQTHTVQEGETLSQIAEAYGVSVEALASANHLISPQQVGPGTVLIIPNPE